MDDLAAALDTLEFLFDLELDASKPGEVSP